MANLTVYKYDNTTFEFVSEVTAFENPVDGGNIMPPNTTRIAPPEIEANQIQVFNGEIWEIKSDFRGTYQVEIATKIISVVEYIGEAQDGFEFVTEEFAKGIIKSPELYTYNQQTHSWTKLADYRGKKQAEIATKEITNIDYIGEIKEGFQLVSEETAADIIANPDHYWIVDGKLEDVHETEEWQEWKAEKDFNDRKDYFENNFFETSLGWFRLHPKGYSNAQQSIDTVNNIVNILGSLTAEIATMVLFYEKPDFAKPEECTEEWLIQHQYSAQPMTKAEWTVFYLDFSQKYAEKMYQQALKGEV